jgi:D-arabinose 1-dehydrogenase-like Zn-dependent alcohol dehydrogenase
MVLGHEGAGVVESIGTGVTKFKIGDRVGFGYFHGGCGNCEFCKIGNQYYCENAPRSYAAQDLDQGSFSSFTIWPDTNIYRIPEALSSADAAPLLCAGITVFTPMLKFGVKAGHRVGIIGIGGLGHLAVKFASKLGAEVVVFSSSESKRKEALALGASEFWVSKELGERKPEKGLDYLIVTAAGHPDWSR